MAVSFKNITPMSPGGAVSSSVLFPTDPAKTMRLLQMLKSCGQKPVEKWDVPLNASSSLCDVSEWVPPVSAVPAKPVKPLKLPPKQPAGLYPLSPCDFPSVYFVVLCCIYL